MDWEQGIDTQRLRLLRIIAGLVVAVEFLSVGPVSRGFSEWACGYVDSILSRAELAARYLVVAQARLMAARDSIVIDRSRFFEDLIFDGSEADFSLVECRARLTALRAMLMDLPREARRLLRRIGRPTRRALCAVRPLPRPDMRRSASLRAWRFAGTRVERPPDKRAARSHRRSYPLPPVSGRESQAV